VYEAREYGLAAEAWSYGELARYIGENAVEKEYDLYQELRRRWRVAEQCEDKASQDTGIILSVEMRSLRGR